MTEFRPPAIGDVPRVAQWLSDTAAHLAVYAPGLLRATSLPPDAAAVEVHVSGGGHSDPTGTAAAGAVDFERESKLTIEQNTLRDYMGVAVEVCDGLMGTIQRLNGLLGPPKPEAAADENCRQGCGRPKGKGRQGNCERCYHWLYEQWTRDGKTGPRPFEVPASKVQQWRDDDAKGKSGRRPAPGHVDHDDPEAA